MKFCPFISLTLKHLTVWDDDKAHTDKGLAERRFSWLQANTNFNQAIIETSNGKDYWIHVSCRKNIKKNRKQVIRYLIKK